MLKTVLLTAMSSLVIWIFRGFKTVLKSRKTIKTQNWSKMANSNLMTWTTKKTWISNNNRWWRTKSTKPMKTQEIKISWMTKISTTMASTINCSRMMISKKSERPWCSPMRTMAALLSSNKSNRLLTRPMPPTTMVKVKDKNRPSQCSK